MTETWWRRRWAPWAVTGAAFLSLGPLALVARLAAPEEGDAGVNCGGIGFGETPCGWDAVGLAYVLLGVPLAVTVLVLLGVLELLGPRGHLMRLTVAGLAAVVPWAAVLAALVAG